MEGNFHIDVAEILQSKAPKLYRKIPKWTIKLFAKLICQDLINQTLKQNEGLTGVPFMENTLLNFRITMHLKGTENLPNKHRRCIFASNHPLGGLDGICLSAVLGKHYQGQIRYLVNDILYFLEPLKDIFIPINKHGAQAKGAVALLNEALASDNQIITFPSGLCSRKTKGVIHDSEWKKMFITKAVEYQRDVVPVYFEAKNSNFFYRLANFRKQIGLKINIEMLLLPREMFKARGSSFTVHFGQPIPWQTFDDSKTPSQWAKEVEKQVYHRIE
ncbi:MAG: 1-acyl-sn-glycerol-3-phosphate acyltransferase [Candidatus Symbiothrix sp.]|jgi:putative hemolysin|nr:1-acyl-sn-glycerol-3-phosphate acyltransferase [Candidatus Symbiothrix sp.]